MWSKYFLYCLIASFFVLFSCHSNKQAKETANVKKGKSKQANDKKQNKNYDVDGLLWRAKKQIGIKYRLGGDSPKEGFDCSGFTRYCFEPFGVKLATTAAQQSEHGTNVAPANAQKGDLIFFKGGNAKSKVVGHVGIVVSGKGNAIKFIHASSSKGIMISGLSEKYFRARFVKIMRMK